MASSTGCQTLKNCRPSSRINDNTSGTVPSVGDRSSNRRARSQRTVQNGLDVAVQGDPQKRTPSSNLAPTSIRDTKHARVRPAQALGNARFLTTPEDAFQAASPERSNAETLLAPRSRRPRKKKPAKPADSSQRLYSTAVPQGRMEPTNEGTDVEDRIPQSRGHLEDQANVMNVQSTRAGQLYGASEAHGSGSTANAQPNRPDRPLWRARPGPSADPGVAANEPAEDPSGEFAASSGPRRSRRLAKRNNEGASTIHNTAVANIENGDGRPKAHTCTLRSSDDKIDDVTHHQNPAGEHNLPQHDSPGMPLLARERDPMRFTPQSHHVPLQTLATNTSAPYHQPPDRTPTTNTDFMAPTTRSQSLAAALEGLTLDVKPPKQAKVKPFNEPMKRPSEKKPAKCATTTTTTVERRLNIMPRPQPTHAYLAQAHQPPQTTPTFRPILVILDLNGTLLKRKHKGGHAFHPRPGLSDFLHYLFTHHRVMVWSSARRENVLNIVRAAFTPQQRDALVAIWSREDLQLSEEAFHAHSQVYKQLSWVWRHGFIPRTNPIVGEMWNQANTVLIDDSTLKAVSEPFNLLEVPEFTNAPEQKGEDVLREVWRYLNGLGFQQDVSAYMRVRPFVHGPASIAAVEQAKMGRHGEVVDVTED